MTVFICFLQSKMFQLLDGQGLLLKNGLSINDGGNFFDSSDDLWGIGRICEDGVKTFLMEGGDFGFAKLIGHGDYLCAAQVFICPDIFTDLCGVDVARHKINYDDMRDELLCNQTGVKTVLCGLNFVITPGLQRFGEVFGPFPVTVDNEDSHFADFHGIGGDVVSLHKADEFAGGDSSVS